MTQGEQISPSAMMSSRPPSEAKGPSPSDSPETADGDDDASRDNALTRALLRGIDTIPGAVTAEQAWQALIDTLDELLEGSAVCVIDLGPSGMALRLSNARHRETCNSAMPAGLLHEDLSIPRLIPEAAMQGGDVPWLGGSASGHRSVMAAPLAWRPDTPDGDIFGAVVALHPAQGRFDRSTLAVMDRLAQLTARTVANLELAAQSRLLAAVVEGSSSGFAIADAERPDAPLVYVNPAFEALTGYSAAEAVGRNCRFLSADPPVAPERLRLADAVAAHSAGRFLLRNRHKDGHLYWNELTLFPVRDATGTVRHLVATQSDVTTRIEAQQDRDRARLRMSEALANSDDGFLLLDADRRVLSANPAVRDLFPATANGADWAVGSRFEANWQAFLSAYTQPGEERNLGRDLRHPDLSTLAQAATGRELRLPDGRTVLVRARTANDGGLVLVATNITLIKTAEKMLRQRAAAIDAAQDGIAISDNSDRLFYVNPSFVEMLGEHDEALLFGRRWTRSYLPAERDAYLDKVRPLLLAQGSAKTRMRLRNSAGDIRHHEVSLSMVRGVGTVIVARDVTERIHYEERQAELQVQLELSRRQEAISQLAAGVAHDFNNLLSAINVSADLIATEDHADPAVRDHARRITTAGHRAARLVNRLLDLGAAPLDSAEIDLRAALRESEDLIRSGLGSRTELSCDYGTVPVLVRASPTGVVQIVLNLMLNAQDALLDGTGTIRLSLGTAAGLALGRPVLGTIDPVRLYGTITVSDTGCGIPSGRLSKIFGAYYSTKGNRGTGMGLSMVATLVESAGGAVLLDSRVDEGSTFIVCIPHATPDLDEGEEATGVPDVDLSGTTILIVDDEPSVAEVIGSYLERYGAEVAICTRPDLALESVQEDPDGWTVLITDYDMPGMNGGALAEAVGIAAPRLPVVVVTALARRLSDPRVSSDKVHAVIAKPVDMRQLLKAIDELIDR